MKGSQESRGKSVSFTDCDMFLTNFLATKAQILLLTPEQKVDVALREAEALRIEINKAEKKGEKNNERLKVRLLFIPVLPLNNNNQALMEEVETRISEMKKEAYEFRRDIVIGAVNQRTGKVVAERVLKYMEDSITQRVRASVITFPLFNIVTRLLLSVTSN